MLFGRVVCHFGANTPTTTFVDVELFGFCWGDNWAFRGVDVGDVWSSFSRTIDAPSFEGNENIIALSIKRIAVIR
jgi:hypothetical protein